MSHAEIVAALSAVFEPFVGEAGLAKIPWGEYVSGLSDVDRRDFGEGLGILRRTHGFRNAPLVSDVIRCTNEARRKRLASEAPKPEPKIDPNAGELREHTITGIGTLKLRVLPDDHPALHRFSCLVCKDSGWRELPAREGLQMTVTRCACWQTNQTIQRERERQAEYQRKQG